MTVSILRLMFLALKFGTGPPCPAARTTVPLNPANSIAIFIGSVLPEVTSNTTSAILPSVMSLTLATASSSSTIMVWVAPISMASSRRLASLVSPVTMICRAPASLAAMTHPWPICPGPWITVVEPTIVPPVRWVHDMPLAMGVNKGNHSAGISLETLNTTELDARYM